VRATGEGGDIDRCSEYALPYGTPSPHGTVQRTARICGHEVMVLLDRERRKPYYEPHKEALDKAHLEFGREAQLLRESARNT
jgi:hypothetical protein